MARDKVKQEYILLTTSNFPTGGACANYLYLFCKGLKENGLYIKVILLKGFAFGVHDNHDKRNNSTKDGILYSYISFIKRPSNHLFKLIDDFFSFIRISLLLFSLFPKRKKTTILVYNYELQANIPIYILGTLLHLRIITFVSEYYDKSVFAGSLGRQIKWYGFLLNFNYFNRLSSHLIVFSSFLKKKYIEQGFPEHKIIVQPNLTDFEFWKSENKDIKYTLGYSGTPSIKDGLNDLLKAIQILKQKGVTVNLLIVGDTVFGPSLIPRLKEECINLHIDDLVDFTGLVSLEEVKNQLSACSILAITRPNTIQTQAGFPTKLGEYFATGKQILSTNFGDISTYFKPMEELVVAECGNPSDIAKKIEWILANVNEAEKLRISGFNKAKQLLSYKESLVKIVNQIN